MYQFPSPVYNVFSAQCPALRKPYAFVNKRTPSGKNAHPKPCLTCLHLRLYCVTMPCHHLLFQWLSGQHALMHTGVEGLDTACSSGVKLWTSLCWPYLILAKTWCHSVPCCPAYNMAMEQICRPHFRTGDWSMPAHRKHVPNVLLGSLWYWGMLLV